ncbi:MAG: hypothetical protein D6732_05830 [Methanobacteriota archaeon]|nr:MAG: hypothetical protein D6732_05830 [Euryarchaeota archaeon]
MKFDVSSKASFVEQIKDALSTKAKAAIDNLRSELIGSVELKPTKSFVRNVSEDEQDAEDDIEGDEIELSLDNEKDLVKAAKIAGSLGLKFTIDDEDGTLEIDDSNEPNIVAKFIDSLSANGIEYSMDSDEGEEE